MQEIDVGVGIIIREGKVLVCRRPSSGALAGMWEFPGGKLEYDETPAEAVVRELGEELGVLVEPVQPLSRVEHAYPEVYVRLYPFLCGLVEGDPQPLASQEVRWVAPEDLDDLGLPPANAELIAEIQAAFRAADDSDDDTPDDEAA
ncbi:MAG: 8-oxo-dGTP diphosphatase MutT [Phycisphaerae bacterium]